MPKRLYFIGTFFLVIASFAISILIYASIHGRIQFGIPVYSSNSKAIVTTITKSNTFYTKAKLENLSSDNLIHQGENTYLIIPSTLNISEIVTKIELKDIPVFQFTEAPKNSFYMSIRAGGVFLAVD